MTTIEATIRKEKLIALKNELKSLAKAIKELKPAHKNAQRKLTGEYRIGSGNGFYSYRYVSTATAEDKKRERNIRSELESFQFQFRHKHIAYCLARGKTYEQIERTVREGNEPNQRLIQAVLEGLNDD